MGKIKKFQLNWGDAWGMPQEGYHSTLETGEDGKTTIGILVNMEPFRINLEGREDALIRGIKNSGIEKISGYVYAAVDVLDGDQWSVDIVADDLNVYAKGFNTFPYELERLLEFLHKEWHLPICKIARRYYHKKINEQDRYGERWEYEEEYRF